VGWQKIGGQIGREKTVESTLFLGGGLSKKSFTLKNTSAAKKGGGKRKKRRGGQDVENRNYKAERSESGRRREDGKIILSLTRCLW